MNMIYCILARQIRHRFKWRKVGDELLLFPHHVHHPSGGNADSTAKIVPLPPSSANWSSALTLPWPSSPSAPAPHCLLLQLHILSTERLCQSFPWGHPSFKKSFQKGIITQLPLVLLPFLLQDLPVHGLIHRISHTGSQLLEPLGHVFFWTLLLILLACIQPCTNTVHSQKVLA